MARIVASENSLVAVILISVMKTTELTFDVPQPQMRIEDRIESLIGFLDQWNDATWPLKGLAQHSKPISRPSNHLTSYTAPHYHLWIQKPVMTALMCPSGSRKSLTRRAGRDCMAPSLEVSALGNNGPIRTEASLNVFTDLKTAISTPLDRRKDGPPRHSYPPARTSSQMANPRDSRRRKISWTKRI